MSQYVCIIHRLVLADKKAVLQKLQMNTEQNGLDWFCGIKGKKYKALSFET
jgi:hypothetical protein